MVRRQAAFHSVLVMCVSRSQKPMQSASDLPPPPGALGANSLGLPGEVPGESARLLEVAAAGCKLRGQLRRQRGDGSELR